MAFWTSNRQPDPYIELVATQTREMGTGEFARRTAAHAFERTTTGLIQEDTRIAEAEKEAGTFNDQWWVSGLTGLDLGNPKAMSQEEFKAAGYDRGGKIAYSPDMTEQRAQILAETFDRRQHESMMLDRNAAGFWRTAVGFGAGLLGNLPDPINLIPIGGATARGASMGARVARAAAEGFVGTAVADTVLLPEASRRGDNVDIGDFLLDTTFGSFFGGGIGAVGGLLHTRRVKSLSGQQADLAEALRGTGMEGGEAGRLAGGVVNVLADMPERSALIANVRQNLAGLDRVGAAKLMDKTMLALRDGENMDIARWGEELGLDIPALVTRRRQEAESSLTRARQAATPDVSELEMLVPEQSTQQEGLLASLNAGVNLEAPVRMVEAQPRFAGRSLWAVVKGPDRTALRQELVGAYDNVSTGWKINLTGSGVDHAVSSAKKSMDGMAHMEAVANLPGLIENAVLVESHADSKGQRLKAVHRMYAPLRLGDDIYAVKLTVKEAAEGMVAQIDDIHRLYDLKLEKKMPGDLRQPPDLAEASGKTGSTPGIPELRLRQLLEGVNDSEGQAFLKSLRVLSERPRLAADDVRGVVDGIAARNAAPVHVVQNVAELPESWRETAKRAEALYDPNTDTVWMVADNIESPERAAQVWAHEQIVHHGLRGMFDKEQRATVLESLWDSMGGMESRELRDIAERYGLDLDTLDGRLLAVEETLAVLAEKSKAKSLTKQEESLWRSLVEYITQALNDLLGRSGEGTLLKNADVNALLSRLGKHVLDGDNARLDRAAVTPDFRAPQPWPELDPPSLEEAARNEQTWSGREMDSVMAEAERLTQEGRAPEEDIRQSQAATAELERADTNEQAALSIVQCITASMA